MSHQANQLAVKVPTRPFTVTLWTKWWSSVIKTCFTLQGWFQPYKNSRLKWVLSKPQLDCTVFFHSSIWTHSKWFLVKISEIKKKIHKREERKSKEEENEGVRGVEEGGDEEHGERSCFYSLSFLAEAKDTLSTDGVYLLGQTVSDCIPLYCIVMYCIVLCYVLRSRYNMYIITVRAKQSGKHSNIMRKRSKWVSAHVRARTHLTTNNQQLQQQQPN